MGAQVRDIDHTLEHFLHTKAFPGAAAIVANQTHTLYQKYIGTLTNDDAPPPFSNNHKVYQNTTFDLASLTKVVATTTAVALLHQDGLLNLTNTIAQHLPQTFKDKPDITVIHLLTHSAGFPPDPTPNYWSPSFGCKDSPLPPETTSPTKSASDCTDAVFLSLAAQELVYAPGSRYLYSDLSFISLMFLVGSLAPPSTVCVGVTGRASWLQCQFAEFVRSRIFLPLGMSRTMFNPDSKVRSFCAPTTVPLSEGVGRVVLQGRVSDGNALVMGGVSGHAGVFSTVGDLMSLTRAYLGGSQFLKADTIRLFTKIQNHTLSSRALGWNTNDPRVPDRGWGLSCGTLWPWSSFTHVGYAGTQICVDPQGQFFSILLTNRVYPSDAHSQMHAVRQKFGDAVFRVFGQRRPDREAKRAVSESTIETQR